MMKPLILVTNDDGYQSPGIAFLARLAARFGDVVVIAPHEGMSGMGHAITIKTPLRYRKHSPNGQYPVYAVEGTPVDCVKLAMRKILGRRPDLILSGINHGSNASVNIIYSGTMAAAFEGAMAGIPSVGFSLLDYDHHAPLEHLEPYMETIIENVIHNGLPSNVCLNVNFPAEGDQKPIRGMKLCRQALGYWKEEFDERRDPHQQPYFWLRGEFIRTDDGTDTDLNALENRFVSIVPVHFDFTARYAFDSLKKWNGVLSDDQNLATHEIPSNE